MAQQQYEYLKLDGIIVPDTQVTRENVVFDFKQVFGQDLDTSSQTPQGVLINQFILQRNALIRNDAALANQINPNLAGGTFLDAIWALTGGQRLPGTPSIAICNLTGGAGAIIPIGVIARTITNEVFTLTQQVTLNIAGTGVGIFNSIVNGPVNAPPGSINIIVSGVLGWETVTNPNPAALGTLTQSDQSLRVLRRQTLALQGQSLPFAITSALNNLGTVKSLNFLENISDIPVVIQNVNLVPHSIYVAVDADPGTTVEDEIAQVLLNKKSAGAAWNGNITVNVTDPTTLQIYPVQFSRADIKIVLAKVYITNRYVPDPVAAVKEAILAYANGELPGEEGFVVGANVSPFELAGAVNKLYPEIFVQRVEVSYDVPLNFTTNELFIEAFEVAKILSGGIEVIES